MNKAIFLDQDGVLNHEIYDYITRVEDFKILECQIPPLKKLYDEGIFINCDHESGWHCFEQVYRTGAWCDAPDAAEMLSLANQLM